MARRSRVVIPGLPHHVLQRAAAGRSLFASAPDYAYYLSLVRDQSARFGLDVWAYCLMPDHVHFICVPRAADSLARVFNTVHMKFALHLLRDDSARSGPARRDDTGLSPALRNGDRDVSRHYDAHDAARRDDTGLSPALRDGARDASRRDPDARDPDARDALLRDNARDPAGRVPADRNPSRPGPSRPGPSRPDTSRLRPFSRGRFRSCVLDDTSLFEEVRFVESNPVRKGLVARPWDYEWSSARSRVFGTPDPVLSNRFPLAHAVSDWREYLLGAKLEEVLARARANLKTGRPCGDAEFVSGLELLTCKRLRPARPGRPRRPAVRSDAASPTEPSASAPSPASASVSALNATRGLSNGVAGSADRSTTSRSAARSSRSQSLKACPAPPGTNPVSARTRASAPVSTRASARASTRVSTSVSTHISTPAPESAIKPDPKAGRKYTAAPDSKYTAAPHPKHTAAPGPNYVASGSNYAASGPPLRPERIKR
jgi:putative transposase